VRSLYDGEVAAATELVHERLYSEIGWLLEKDAIATADASLYIPNCLRIAA
jgi:hypothetical protein